MVATSKGRQYGEYIVYLHYTSSGRRFTAKRPGAAWIKGECEQRTLRKTLRSRRGTLLPKGCAAIECGDIDGYATTDEAMYYECWERGSMGARFDVVDLAAFSVSLPADTEAAFEHLRKINALNRKDLLPAPLQSQEYSEFLRAQYAAINKPFSLFQHRDDPRDRVIEYWRRFGIGDLYEITDPIPIDGFCALVDVDQKCVESYAEGYCLPKIGGVYHFPRNYASDFSRAIRAQSPARWNSDGRKVKAGEQPIGYHSDYGSYYRLYSYEVFAEDQTEPLE